MILIFLLVIIVLIAGVTVACLYMLTLQNTLKAVAFNNRKMEPGMVWLLLIPVFNLVWQFIVAKNIAASIEAEYRSRGLAVPHMPTYKAGLLYSVLNCLMFPFYYTPVLKFVCMTAAFISWIVYWTQVAEYKNKLRALPPADYADSEIFGNINRI